MNTSQNTIPYSSHSSDEDSFNELLGYNFRDQSLGGTPRNKASPLLDASPSPAAANVVGGANIQHARTTPAPAIETKAPAMSTATLPSDDSSKEVGEKLPTPPSSLSRRSQDQGYAVTADDREIDLADHMSKFSV